MTHARRGAGPSLGLCCHCWRSSSRGACGFSMLRQRFGRTFKSILVNHKTRTDRFTKNIITSTNRPATSHSANGYIGRGTRYRLGEVLCGFYPADEEARTDAGDDAVIPLGESLQPPGKLPNCHGRTLTTLLVCIPAPSRFSQKLGDIGSGLHGVRARCDSF